MSSNNWCDFNDAELQQPAFELIPRGAIVPVRMTIKPGGYDDPSQSWTGGYATESFETGSVYLAAEFVVTGGPYAKRRLWTNIGLHSKKGPTWGQMGRSFVRAALNSARGVMPHDNSPQAAAARRIAGLSELDGLEFVARVEIEKDSKGQERNVVKLAVEPDHPEYASQRGAVMHSAGVLASPAMSAAASGSAPATASSAASAGSTRPAASVAGKPAWAQ